MDSIILGLIGNPLGHSLSPLMHSKALAHMGIDGVYLPLTVKPENLEQAVKGIRALNFTGVNVTIPYKEAVISFLDELDEEAGACGAVNLIENRQGHLIGHNVDGKAFVSALRQAGIPVKGRAVLIGAGGAARSVAFSLAKSGVEELCFLDIQKERANKLASYLSERVSVNASAALMEREQFLKVAAGADLLVNCSPQGMYPHVDRSPLESLDGLSSATVVCDLVYNPVETRMLRMARERGMKHVSGIEMFVEQGALSLELWTGQSAPREQMKAVVLDVLTK